MYLTTYSGCVINLLDLTPVQIRTKDIAHSLSQLCRFAGHTKGFYSVAQHSLLVSNYVRDEGHPPLVQLQALLHDATEAYVVDLPRPIKRMLEGYQVLEKIVWEKIAQRYQIPDRLPPVVKEADDRLLATEFRDLMTFKPPVSWALAEPLPISIVPIAPVMAERLFAERLNRLLKEVHNGNPHLSNENR